MPKKTFEDTNSETLSPARNLRSAANQAMKRVSDAFGFPEEEPHGWTTRLAHILAEAGEPAADVRMEKRPEKKRGLLDVIFRTPEPATLTITISTKRAEDLIENHIYETFPNGTATFSAFNQVLARDPDGTVRGWVDHPVLYAHNQPCSQQLAEEAVALLDKSRPLRD